HLSLEFKVSSFESESTRLLLLVIGRRSAAPARFCFLVTQGSQNLALGLTTAAASQLDEFVRSRPLAFWAKPLIKARAALCCARLPPLTQKPDVRRAHTHVSKSD